MSEAPIYAGPEGRIYRETYAGGAGVQFRAVRHTTKGQTARRYDTQAGAMGWLRRLLKAEMTRRGEG